MGIVWQYRSLNAELFKWRTFIFERKIMNDGWFRLHFYLNNSMRCWLWYLCSSFINVWNRFLCRRCNQNVSCITCFTLCFVVRITWLVESLTYVRFILFFRIIYYNAILIGMFLLSPIPNKNILAAIFFCLSISFTLPY